jgi:[acyl-carrier-protein] S-malonyltransferase
VQTFVDVAAHQGEHLYVAERLVISPRAGVFEPANAIRGATTGSETIAVGTIIGHIADQEVRSPFAGTLMGMFALPGERVQAGQRIAWLRISQSAA